MRASTLCARAREGKKRSILLFQIVDNQSTKIFAQAKYGLLRQKACLFMEQSHDVVLSCLSPFKQQINLASVRIRAVNVWCCSHTHKTHRRIFRCDNLLIPIAHNQTLLCQSLVKSLRCHAQICGNVLGGECASRKVSHEW